MKNLLNRLPKKFLAALVVAGTALSIAGIATAWSPDRPTYTIEHPADHVTFNSITNNPNYGDERTFFDAKDNANQNAGGFADKVQVKDGQELLIRTYVHNNAADNLNGMDFSGPGVAKNTQVRIHLPTATDKALRANSYVTADNAQPGEVSDTVDFTGDLPFSLEYVPGSAVAYNNAHDANGMPLSDSIVTTGAKIGYTTANGVVPGCFQYTNIVTVRVKVHMENPGYKLEKKVGLPGGQWSENVTAEAGQTVSYQLGFTNTGNTTLNDVIVRDQLPKHMSLVAGTTKIYNSNNPNGLDADTDGIVSNGGIDIGHYGAGSGAYVQFKATVDGADKLDCGTNTLTNIGEVSQGSKKPVTDTAVVVVEGKKCETPKAPVCSLLTLDQKDRNVTATVKYSPNGHTFKQVSVDFGDKTPAATSNQATDNTVKVSHTYGADVTSATVKATVVFEDASVTDSKNCEKTVSFTKTPETPTKPETPATLTNTGAGSVLGIFLGTSAIAAVAYNLVARRRVALNQ